MSFSSRQIHAAIALSVIAAVLFATGLASLVFYWHAYLTTEDLRLQAAEFSREKEALLGKLAGLEDSLSRTERFATKIEAAIGNSREKYTGKGPVDESDSAINTESIDSITASVSLGNRAWKSPFSRTFTNDLKFSLGELEKKVDTTEDRIHTAFSFQQDKHFFWASLPSLWPARGWVTSDFGDHRGWRGHGRMHEGIDIAGPRGTPILSPGNGIVTFVGYYHGYGQMVTIDHGYGISTLYGHCSAMYVREGQRVNRGMIIAAVGNTGSSTGPHLHYEVHVDGVPVNPMMYVMQ